MGGPGNGEAEEALLAMHMRKWAAWVGLPLHLAMAPGALAAPADVGGAAATGAQPAGVEITVMSFNLRRGDLDKGERAWTWRRQAVLAVLRQANPDIVVTQEGTLAMLHDLTENLPGYDWVGVSRAPGPSEEYSGAIFYRISLLQVVAAGQFWLSETPEEPGSRLPGALPRLANWVRFRHRPTAREFVVYGTHLDHQSQRARELGAELIQQHIIRQSAHVPLPVLVAGDLNAPPSNRAIQLLRAGQGDHQLLLDAADWLRSQGQPVGATYHGYRGILEGEPIDYILHSSEWEVLTFQVLTDAVDGIYPSDHYPILARLRLAAR